MADNDLINYILQARQQGMSNNQIIQILQGQGFSSQQVFDAMSQADTAGQTGAPVETGQNEDSQASMPPPPSEAAPSEAPPPQAEEPVGEAELTERIEELTEAIINEKWNELVKDINKIIEWKNKMDSTIAGINQKIEDLRNNFEQLHGGILGKVKEYDEHIGKVGAEVGAMQKAFKQILPTLTENVNTLSDVAKTMKKGSKTSATTKK